MWIYLFKVMDAFRECVHLLLVQWPHIELLLSVVMILPYMIVLWFQRRLVRHIEMEHVRKIPLRREKKINKCKVWKIIEFHDLWIHDELYYFMVWITKSNWVIIILFKKIRFQIMHAQQYNFQFEFQMRIVFRWWIDVWILVLCEKGSISLSSMIACSVQS